MTDIPILGAGPHPRARSSEEKAHDQQLAARLGQLALEADAGNLRAGAFVFIVEGEAEPRSFVHDKVEDRARLTARVDLLGHMLRTTEMNRLMAAQPGGQPRAVRSQALIEGQR